MLGFVPPRHGSSPPPSPPPSFARAYGLPPTVPARCSYKKVYPLLVDLRGETMRERHWTALMHRVGTRWALADMTLGFVCARPPRCAPAFLLHLPLPLAAFPSCLPPLLLLPPAPAPFLRLRCATCLFACPQSIRTLSGNQDLH